MRKQVVAIVLLCASGIVEAAGGLLFTAPDGWQKVATASSMRVAQYSLPRADGDAEDAELVLYYFGGGGGGVDANIERWLGQVQQPDGRPTRAVAKKETRTVNGLEVTLLDVRGTYIAEMAPGASERHNKSNFRLRAGVVMTPQGPYYIKLTGPQNTVTKWDQSFERFVASLRFE
ncbi:MAG: hypothetical protein DMF91_08335 [Acidobacteria bacterium]|nr:MAG: hypothetical protein DMF91_08335 [Acidobacteriota bacterium]